jgi:hypothetical protein
VSQSLEKRFEWLVPGNPSKDGEGGSNNGARTGTASAHDYLEKIFQIPFWLKPMEVETCTGLLKGLTRTATMKPDEAAARPENPPAGEGTSQTPAANGTGHVGTEAGSENSQQASGQQSQSGSDEIKKNPPPVMEGKPKADEIEISPKSLELEERELQTMEQLAPLLGRSPRAVKRFVNCYRLIKVSLTADNWKRFFGDENLYVYVLTLLAVVTGAPAICGELFRSLREVTTIADLIPMIEENRSRESNREWLRAEEVLMKGGLEIAKLKEALPLVERYSFKRVEPVG